MNEQTLLRPRHTLAVGWLVHWVVAVPLFIVAVRHRGMVRIVAGVGALLLGLVSPLAMVYGSRIRKLTIDPHGLHLAGFRLDRSVPWQQIATVDFRKVGPTAFLVARVMSVKSMPALSPFRRKFARELRIGDHRCLLVVRTVDFPGGYPAVLESLRMYAPDSVAFGDQLPD